MRAAENVDYLLRTFLMERAEDRDDVVRTRLVFVRVVVPGPAFDAVGEAELRDISRGLGGYRLEVYGHARRARIRLAHENRVRARSAGEVEDARARGDAEHRDDSPADAHGASEHGRRERLRARGVFAEVQLRTLHGLPRLGELGEAPPCGVHVAVVADRPREVRGRARYQRGLRRLGVEVLPVALLEKALGDACVEEEPHPARRRRRELPRLDAGEHVAVYCGEEDGASVVRAREVDDFRYVLHVTHCTSTLLVS